MTMSSIGKVSMTDSVPASMADQHDAAPRALRALHTGVEATERRVQRQSVRLAFRAVDDLGNPARVGVVDSRLGTPTAVRVVLARRICRRAPQQSLRRVEEQLVRLGAHFRTGVLEHRGPEIRTRQLTRITMVGIARNGHPLFRGRVGAHRFAVADHIDISRPGKRQGPIDSALAERGSQRRIAVVVPSHTSALMLARTPTSTRSPWPTGSPAPTSALGLRTFPIPLDPAPPDLGMAWRPRNAAYPAHRWFRDHVAATFLAPSPSRNSDPGDPREPS